MRRSIIGVIAAVVGTSHVQAASVTVNVNEPREFGYFLGDTLSREIVVTTQSGTRLRQSALPQPGARDYWLDLTEQKLTTTTRGNATEHRLLLTYQVFYSALEPKRLRIPGFKLFFEGPPTADDKAAPTPATDAKTPQEPNHAAATANAPGTFTETITPLEIIVSPLREIIPEKTTENDGPPLRPDAYPAPPGTGVARSGMLASALATLALLTALAYHNAWFPFGARQSRPFARAARLISANAAKHQDTQLYDQDCIILHRAFDEAYGRRVFASDVKDFLIARREFQALKPRVEQFFSASEVAFFAGKPDAARTIVPPDELSRLAQDLAKIERQAA